MSDYKTDLNSLYPYVMPELPKCPAPLIDREIIAVLSDWCQKTQCWTYDVDAMYIRAGNADYDLDGWPTAMATIDAILSAKLDDTELEPITDFTRPENAIIRLVSVPTESRANALAVTVSLKPCRTATQTDRDLFDEYFQHWANGVMGRLMMMEGKTWSNPQLGMLKSSLYETAKCNVKGHVMRGKLNGQLLMNTRRFV